MAFINDVSDTEFLYYITLTRCIPNEWKEKLNHEHMTYTQPTYTFSLIDTEQKICKLIYKTLVKNKIPKSPNRAMTHWQHTFDDMELQWSRYLHVYIHSQLTQSFVLYNTNTYENYLMTLFFINIVLYHPVVLIFVYFVTLGKIFHI